ncbi:MAG TPA: FAD/NAD(P)-binding protein [Polyangia bacterium]|jgi:NAD(P)H-flavin reductase
MVAAAPAPPLPAPFTVVGVTRETRDTVTVTLAPDQPGVGAAAPGQFNMLYAFGVGEAPISTSGDPARPDRLVHTIRAIGLVTRALTRVRRGDALGVRGPYGVGWPLDEARGHDVVVVAGGVGLAPLRGAIYHLLRHRADYGRVCLLYGARTPADLLFRRELERWRGRLDLEVAVTVDRAERDWRGRVDVVPALVAAAGFEPERALAFCCGPEVMMRYAVRELAQRGVPASRVFVSLERSMRCGVGLCGHCQLLPFFACKDGPVLRADRVMHFMERREV